MALKALDIFKLLPKTNCRKCGCPTCLAFAMKLATQKGSLDECPDVSAESKAMLEGASAPPIRLVAVGMGAAKLEIGNETVMFRHDESFYHAPGIGVIVPDRLDAADRKALLDRIRALAFVRVGTRIAVNVVGVQDTGTGVDAFVQTVREARELGLPLVLMTSEPAHAKAALEVCAADRPLLHGASEANRDAFAAVAKEAGCPVAVVGPDADSVAATAVAVRGAGVENIILDLSCGSFADSLQALTAVRRLGLKRKADGVGYPSMVLSTDPDERVNFAACCSYVAKYAGIVLTTLSRPEELLPILTVSQNIYTDPRKPVQVEPKLYAVGHVTPESPLLITTNFSLTYYTVEGEVEASRVPAYIGVIDTEGTSVLTAFASDKLSSEKVTALLKSDDVTKAVSHRKVIIPGYVAAMSGGLVDDSGWEVLVGPREASALPRYLKTVWPGA